MDVHALRALILEKRNVKISEDDPLFLVLLIIEVVLADALQQQTAALAPILKEAKKHTAALGTASAAPSNRSNAGAWAGVISGAVLVAVLVLTGQRMLQPPVNAAALDTTRWSNALASVWNQLPADVQMTISNAHQKLAQ